MIAHKIIDCCEGLQKSSASNKQKLHFSSLSKVIDQAIKFELAGVDLPGGNLSYPKLPFNTIYIEVVDTLRLASIDKKERLTLGILAIDNDDHILIVPTQIWSSDVCLLTYNIRLYKDLSLKFYESEWLVSGESLDKDRAEYLSKLYADMIVDFCNMVNCSNIIYMDNPAPEKLNKKRVKKGKQPLYSYKTLHIKTDTRTVNKNNQGGTHASPRVHFRRGHIRQLANNSIWVQPCMVGSKELGMVHKGYRV